ncbi:MAG: hypothetical protein ABI904_10845 [Chloroflexota bacterium]
MILDFIDKLELSDSEIEKHFDARMALARLGEGLFWIHQEVAKIEMDLRRKAAKNDVQLAIAGGILEDKPFGLLSCAFQWYAVSACNYAQLVGWLATRDTDSSKKYVRKVMPRLLNYRNKVAAHFAITDPLRDNEADLAASVMTHIVYVRGMLCAAALTPIIKNESQEITVSKDISWSLTLAHERLVPRFWKNGKPKSSQAIKAPPGETKINISWADLLENDM